MNVSRALLIAAALLACTPLFADNPPGTIGYNQWATCPIPASAAATHTPAPAAVSANAPTHVSADHLAGYVHGESLLSGNVHAAQGNRQMTAAQMQYNSTGGDTHASGNVHFVSPNMELRGPTADYNFNNSSGVFNDAEFSLPQRHGRGSAKLLKALDPDHDVLSDVHYTTCPVGSRDWMLNAPDLEINQATNTGVGHNVTIDFFGVPIFWTPYINFPLNDARKSGFLDPSFGFSTFTGTDLSTPYYFNLAPNYDATFVPRIITKRGVDLGGEFRWLTFGGSQGQIDTAFLPHDKLADRERGLLNFSDSTPLATGWNFNTAYNWVSDNLYFQDLGDSLATIATTTQERHLAVSYGQPASDWTFLTQLQEWQVVDPAVPPASYPYKRLPQALLNWQSSPDLGAAQFSLNTEFDQFQQDERIGAARLDLKPSASYSFGAAAWYFTPTAAMRVTEYDFNQNVPAGMQSNLSRVTPILSLDSGLFFQRNIGSSYLQTLEPRLFYLYVPYRDQSQIPLFDTIQPQFSFLQLFTDNSFYGADRQADANQLSYALTSRLLDASDGSELLEADLGQIRYFRNRDVQLPSVAPQTNLFSDVVGDLILNLNNNWSTSYGQQWDPATRQTDLASVGLQYHPAFHQVLNLAYRYNRALNLKQTDVSFAWPLGRHWSVVGRWNYDVQNKLTLESFAGFEYDSCCWAFQIVHRRYITQTGQANTAIFFQLQLKGLTSIGRHLEDFLQNGILGYSDTTPPQ
ncbi:MAG: LPS assembly protein LptD [Gammaproteobacteria bacterium]|nr:LPS assembly protein LptD [Gammaproteobacteria bacterium]